MTVPRRWFCKTCGCPVYWHQWGKGSACSAIKVGGACTCKKFIPDVPDSEVLNITIAKEG